MSREYDRDTIHCTLRLPDDGLAERIRRLADAHMRSLNAELVHLLNVAIRVEACSS